ncbi:MAG: hypothetical protein LBL70_02295 [Treponema sp.]|jgi:hypothetical protein|nr:hypothetical protein [Treponema sp.]
MKKIFYSVLTVLFLLPPALSAQEFNPARGPLEGVWETETDEENLIIFTGNLFLIKDRGSAYTVYPGMEYGNGRAHSPAAGYAFNYKVSGNTLTIADEYNEGINFKRSNDVILQNKSPLEGIWTAPYSDSDITGVITCIFTGRLLIALLESDSFFQYSYSDGLEFTYSDTDSTIVTMEGTISCVVSGDTMTLSDEKDSLVFRKK